MDAKQKEEAIKVLSDPATVEKVTEKAFADIDTDKSGFIERCELKPLLNKISKQLNLPFPEEKDIDEGLKQLDLNKDGKLQFSEFLPFYEQIMIKL